MNDIERARARRLEHRKNACPYCLTTLAIPEQSHRCPHDLPCEFEEEYEFKLRCGACADAGWQRARLESDLPSSSFEALRAIGEMHDSTVLTRRTAWKELKAS